MQTTTESHDYLWGAGPIGEHLGLSERQAFYMLEKGHIPARKIGARWVTSRADLDEFMHSAA